MCSLNASEQEIAAVAYLSAIDEKGATHVRFFNGKSKLFPLKGHTVPRLELCGTVLAIV